MKNRIYKRIPVSAVVNYAIQGRSYQDYVKDISNSGLFIETRERFAIGQRIVLTFSHSNVPKTIKSTGKIIRNSSNGFAVAFEDDRKKVRTSNKKWDAERRNRNRANVREGTFVVINYPYPILGIITDISEDGLAFAYSEIADIPKILPSIDIVSTEDSSGVENLQVRARWGKKLSRKYRKMGVQFHRITNNQKSKLRSIIQH